MIDERALNIYTDGSCKPHPRRGGIGILYIYVDELGKEISEPLVLPGYQAATNNEMELMACVLALQNAHRFLQTNQFTRIIVFTDSRYVVDNYKSAMFLWPRTKWLRKSGAPVLNAQLWKDLVKAMRRSTLRVDFQKVKAHSSDQFNKAADKLAKHSASLPLNKPIAHSTVRRKRSKERTQIGSVPAQGQRITIRIVECERLSVQQIYRYRFEVLSRSSQYYRKVDFACSDEVMREGHTYSVRLNSEPNNPRIVKLFREISPKQQINARSSTGPA